MIRDWRDAWQEGTSSEFYNEPLFPFGFVQVSHVSVHLITFLLRIIIVNVVISLFT